MAFKVEDTSAVPQSVAVAVCSTFLWLLQLPFVCLRLLFGGPVTEMLVFGSPPPEPPIVAALGRPRSFLAPAAAAALSPREKALTAQLAALLEKQLLSGAATRVGGQRVLPRPRNCTCRRGSAPPERRKNDERQ